MYESNKNFEKIHASTIEKYMKYKRIESLYDEKFEGENILKKPLNL